MKIRFCQTSALTVRSQLSEQFGREIFELDTNAPIGLGAFTRPLSKLLTTPTEAITAAVASGYLGDILVTPRFSGVRQGWQVFGRRLRNGQKAIAERRVLRNPIDRKSIGSGRIFIA